MQAGVHGFGTFDDSRLASSQFRVKSTQLNLVAVTITNNNDSKNNIVPPSGRSPHTALHCTTPLCLLSHRSLLSLDFALFGPSVVQFTACPLSAGTLSFLPSVFHRDTMALTLPCRYKDCTICLESLALNGGAIAVTPCGHCFHKSCYDPWSAECTANNRATTCPYCKQVVSESQLVSFFLENDPFLNRDAIPPSIVNLDTAVLTIPRPSRDCAICLELLARDGRPIIFVAPCRHCFHKDCFDVLSTERTTRQSPLVSVPCPCCSQAVVEGQIFCYLLETDPAENVENDDTEDMTRFFKLFEESTFEGSRAAAQNMKKIAKHQVKQNQKFLLIRSLYLLLRSNLEMLSWPNSPLLVMLHFVSPHVMSGDEAGVTPLHYLADVKDPCNYSIHEKQLVLAKQLIEHGANVNAVSIPVRMTPLHRACHWAKATNLDFVELLLKNGADPNARDYLGRTPLMYTTKDAPGAAKLLLDWPTTDANIISQSGYSFLAMVRETVEFFSDEIGDSDGPEQIQHHFSLQQWTEIEAMLVERGATDTGNTAIE
jgi:hypothetical protein